MDYSSEPNTGRSKSGNILNLDLIVGIQNLDVIQNPKHCNFGLLLTIQNLDMSGNWTSTVYYFNQALAIQMFLLFRYLCYTDI